jgi:manganese/zinc/iron transport system permease protein
MQFSGFTWSLDGWIIVAGVLCAVSAALLGNFLVLRKLSLLGDAISHAVLPGLAAAFLVTHRRDSIAMFVGAAIAGVFTALLTEWIRRRGRVDEGGAMGVVFTTLFAVGLIMIVRAADHVDLDPSCVLHGAIEFSPLDLVRPLSAIGIPGWAVPRVVVILSLVLAVNVVFVSLCHKELKVTAFDPDLATSIGMSAAAMHYALMVLVALTAVASFESVGNILVVAMFVGPPAAASLCTDRLVRMILLSVLFAATAAITGHLAAVSVPTLFGFHSTTSAGMMAVMTGVVFGTTMFLAPRHGIVARWWNRHALTWKIVSEDVIASLYRHSERTEDSALSMTNLQASLGSSTWLLPAIVGWLMRSGMLVRKEHGYVLTNRGRAAARSVVRSHRLWESYLVSELGMDLNRIHAQAEALEHFTDRELRERLDRETTTQSRDPHGSPIPPELLE